MTDTGHLINEYLAGLSVPQLSEKYGIPATTIYFRLNRAGVNMRKIGEATSATKRAKRSLYSAEVANRFLAGESVKQLSLAYGRDRKHIASCLADHGITPRNRSQGMFQRMANASPEERARLSEKAHEAVRNKPSEYHHAISVKQAISKQASLSKIGAGEPEMLQWLAERGYEGIPQLACGVYNIDIAVGFLAVEVHVNPVDPHNHPHFRKRIKYLLSCGFDVLYIKASKRYPVDEGAADYAVSFLQRASRNPSAPCEYRMVRGNGQFVTAMRLDSDELSLVPMTGHGLDFP